MTRRERVIEAIEHRATDIVPYHARFTALELNKLVAYTGDPDFELHFGNHINIVRCMDFVEETMPGLFHDEFGVVWDRRDGSDIGLPSEWILKTASLDGLKLPEPQLQQITAQMKTLENDRDSFKMVNAGFTLYERAWSMRGFEDTLADMLLEEDFIGELFDKIVDYNIACMDAALKTGVTFDAFYFGDDWGKQKGMIMGAATWRKLIFPRIAKLLEYSKRNGKYNVLHSCGDIIETFPDLIDAGLDVYETFQPEIYDIAAVKQKFGDKLSFLGGISTQRLLPYESPKNVYKATNTLMEMFKNSGGLIAAPTHDIPADVPVENVLAMLKAFENQQKNGEN